ncbi:hypothetical protein M885DRAFT_545002 [Pelagophyceae sp. CCMP2097]|nr:hypothetical protein M885DRAFT_545002 [Pelagophyceae sp. CCMP2097]
MQRVLVVVGLSHALMGRAPCPRSRRAVVRPLSTEAAQALLQERDVAMRDGAEDVAAAAYDAAAARGAVRTLAASADGVTLGIAAPTLASTLATLKAWTDALRLHRGTLFGADVDGEPVDVPGPIFLKYSPNGEARLRHDADTRTRAGVLFYPHVAAAAGEEVSVAQYLLPLALFDGDLGGAASMADAGAALTGKQKLLLRGRAVSLGGKLPTLDLPRDGATAPFLRQLEDSVARHELVEVRMPFEKKSEAQRVAEDDVVPAARAQLVHVLGHTCLVYRPSDPPVIDLDKLEKGDPNGLLATKRVPAPYDAGAS